MEQCLFLEANTLKESISVASDPPLNKDYKIILARQNDTETNEQKTDVRLLVVYFQKFLLSF